MIIICFCNNKYKEFYIKSCLFGGAIAGNISAYLPIVVPGIFVFQMIGTGIVMGWHPSAGFIYLIPACLIVFFACWCVSWIFALVGILVKSSGTISGVSMLISMLLGFLSNAIVSPDTFPAPIRAFAKINPVTHLVNAFNAIVNTGTFGTEAMMALGVSAVFAIIIIPVTVVVYHKKI